MEFKELFQAALEQRYGGAIGSKNEIFGEVVAAYGNSITSEDQIPALVAGVEPLLKKIQSAEDKVRSLEQRLKTHPSPTEQPPNPDNRPDPEPKPEEQPDLATTIAEAVAAQMKEVVTPLQEKLAAFEAAKAKEGAVAALDNFVNGWDYAGGFPKERDAAKRVAMKVYKAGGEQMSGEELIAAFREEFDPAVKEKGVTDFTHPFKSDGGGGDGDLKSRFEAFAKRQEERQGPVAN